MASDIEPAKSGDGRRSAVPDLLTFEEVLRALGMQREELATLATTGQIMAFRDGVSFSFLGNDVARLAEERGIALNRPLGSLAATQGGLFEELELSLAAGETDFDAPDEVRRLRTRLGLTQEELADQLGVAFATVNRWENGHSQPSRLARLGLNALAAGNAPAREEATVSDAGLQGRSFHEPDAVAEEVRALRLQLGLTQEGLAAKLGVTFASVNRWENGHSTPHPAFLSDLRRLARESGVVSLSRSAGGQPAVPDIIPCRNYKDAKQRKQGMPNPDEWGIYNADRVFLYRITT